MKCTIFGWRGGLVHYRAEIRNRRCVYDLVFSGVSELVSFLSKTQEFVILFEAEIWILSKEEKGGQ